MQKVWYVDCCLLNFKVFDIDLKIYQAIEAFSI